MHENACDVYLTEESVEELLRRLSRIEGQVRGVQRMIKERRSCDEILIQISAIKSALGSVTLKLLEDHVESCVKPAVLSGDEKALEEFVRALKHVLKGGC